MKENFTLKLIKIMKKIYCKHIVSDEFIFKVFKTLKKYIEQPNVGKDLKRFKTNVLSFKGEDILLSLIKGDFDNRKKTKLLKGIESDEKSIFTKLFERFRNKLGYEFVELYKSKGVRICPYCNINELESYYDPDKPLKPPLDHIINKSSDWLNLSINIFNLTPSCNTCNSFHKGTRGLLKGTNPYKNSIHSKFKLIIIGGPINDGNTHNKSIEVITEDININKYLDKDLAEIGDCTFAVKQRLNSNYIREIIINTNEIMSHNKSFDDNVLTKLSTNGNIYNYEKRIEELSNIHEVRFSKVISDNIIN